MSAKIKPLLDDFVDIIVDELPNVLQPIRSINYHIYLIIGASIRNMASYIMTPKKNQEIRKEVQEF